ncbi:MAG: hypothetical protein QNJ70_31730 [Xenococcaceae cyanobacterium MO_207.B15]|nr:hypothetical protein [Xenococcaceae cyanobacterium MO_207.B15]
MLKVTTQGDSIRFGDGFALNFQRTLRIPDDGKTYPLPPGLGTFPICRVEDYSDHVPESWLERGGVFIPMYQREALWISFNARHWKPNAIKVAIGKINAVSGKPWHQKLQTGEQTHRSQPDYDYLVAPPQPWLDGINAGDGYIKQFVAMPLGMGYTIEGQVTGKEEFGGIQIIVYEAKPGKFPEPSKGRKLRRRTDNQLGAMGMFLEMERSISGEMGMGAGGKMKQKIYPDPHGIDTWDENNYGRVYVHIINSMMYREITGKEPPTTPITAKTYAQYQLPWFDLYDETMSDIAPSSVLSQVKSIKEMDAQKQFSSQQDDNSVDISNSDIINYPVNAPKNIQDGNW